MVVVSGGDGSIMLSLWAYERLHIEADKGLFGSDMCIRLKDRLGTISTWRISIPRGK